MTQSKTLRRWELALLLGVALISSGLLWLGRRGFPQTAEKPAV